LSWKIKSAAYTKQYGIHTSGEALRGKQNQMEMKLASNWRELLE
jgi:hypothetical protein